MPEVGRLAVCLALLFAAYGVLAGVAGGLRRRAHLVRSAEHAAYAVFGLVVIATAILLRALLRHDFTLEYVAAYSSSTLPTQYTVAALWGGQKGSLLFWSFLLTLFTTIVQVQNRERNRALMPFVTATLMTVAVFFLSLLVFVTDPFERLPVAAREGADLNPLLQNYWMMIHPPSLYTGYVSASVPFAFAIAALATGQLGDRWTRSVRRWALFSWAFLSLGNLLGARWAYEVLGWGGYWAWDPVENAAFMPWLTATAFLHSVMIQERRRMLKLWNLALVIMTFGLTLFGTFLTRSGVIASVHAFTQGTIGAFFLGFLALVLLTALGLLAWRWDALGAQGALDSVVSRESAFLLNNVMLVAAAFTVFFGTVFPLLSEALRGVKVSVGAPFFNQVNVPLFLGLIFLMGVGPLIAWRRASVDNLRRNFLGPVLTGVAAATFFFALGVRSALAVLTLALTVFVAATIALDFARATRARARLGEPLLPAMGGLLRRHNRRYGGFVVHLGILIIAVGVTGSQAWSVQTETTLDRGQSAALAGYRVRFEDLTASEESNHFKVAGTFTVSDGRVLGVLRPAKKFYPQEQSPIAYVDYRLGLREDIYLVLGDFARDGSRATVKFQVNRLVSWIWIGGLVLTAGAGLAILPETKRTA